MLLSFVNPKMAQCDDIQKQESLYPKPDPDPLKSGSGEEDLSRGRRLLRRIREFAVYLRWLWCA